MILVYTLMQCAYSGFLKRVPYVDVAVIAAGFVLRAVAGAAAMVLALGVSRLCLLGIRRFVASMGIVLNAGRIYPQEWAILLIVFLLSILPTSIATRRMAGKDGMSQL